MKCARESVWFLKSYKHGVEPRKSFSPPSPVIVPRGGVFIFIPALEGDDSMHMNPVIKMFKYMAEDVRCVKDRDPAARCTVEVLFLYPGLHAIWTYRIAHFFQNRHFYFLARALSQHAAKTTGIEIHPGARIGRRFFIDHGHGVVIGETTEIGDDVTIYQGVTLGGTGKDKGKRHPTIGNNVMIGSGAKVLGPFKVGDNSNIASGAVVLDEIPANSTAVGVPAQIVRRDGIRIDNLDQIHVPDPIKQEINALQAQIDELKKQQK